MGIAWAAWAASIVQDQCPCFLVEQRVVGLPGACSALWSAWNATGRPISSEVARAPRCSLALWRSFVS
eukprot:1989668-Pyramimonas_sp.AAC.1